MAAAMLEQRRVMISGRLDGRVVADAVAQLMYLDGTDAEPVSVTVNAESDDLDTAVPLIDTLGLMRTPLHVDVLGRAHGAAGLLVASAPGVRRIGRTGSISLRIGSPPAMVGASALDIERAAEWWDDLQRRVAALVALRAERTIEWVRSEMRNGATYGATEAVEAGLVDEVR